MLVLARKVDQSILLDGGKIRISVLEVHGGRVKLGIEAPKEIAVQREPAGSRPEPRLLSFVRGAEAEMEPGC